MPQSQQIAELTYKLEKIEKKQQELIAIVMILILIHFINLIATGNLKF